MSIIIAGKMGFAAAGIVIASLGGVWLVRLFNQETVDIYGFLEVVSSTADVNKASGVQDPDSLTGKKELECKITGFKKFWCSAGEVAELTNDVKKHVSLDKLKGSEKSTEIIDQLEEKKFYKITILLTDFDKPQPESPLSSPSPTADWKTISVFEKNTAVLLGSISALQQIQGDINTSLGSGKTNMFVGQVSESITTTDITDYKCYWKSENIASKNCKIFPYFDSTVPTQVLETTMSSLLFKKDGSDITVANKIKEHHYYLIEFTDSYDLKELESFDLEDLIYAKKPSSDSDDKKVTFSKISAVKVVGEQLLILKESAST